MDNEQAKLILGSFRPDGSDANDPAFAEALELATQSQELGEWLASERAQDLAFAAALADVPIPENLREEIFGVLANGISSPGYDQVDLGFAEALAAIEPPANLRSDILAAMQVEEKVTRLPQKEKRSWFSFPALPSIGLAAAAGLVLAFVWTAFRPANPDIRIAEVTPSQIEQGAISFLTSNVSLDRRDQNQENLYQFLAGNELPTPEVLPVSLQNAEGVGCKELTFNDRPASLICYREDSDSPTVHLVVLRRDQVEGEDLPLLPGAKKNCNHCEMSGWSVASWRDEEKAFFLLGQMSPTQLAAFF